VREVRAFAAPSFYLTYPVFAPWPQSWLTSLMCEIDEWRTFREVCDAFCQSCARLPLALSRDPVPKSGWKEMYKVETQALIRHRRHPRIVLHQAAENEEVDE